MCWSIIRGSLYEQYRVALSKHVEVRILVHNLPWFNKFKVNNNVPAIEKTNKHGFDL